MPHRDLAIGILAGGAGSRVGGVDKGWLFYQGTPLIERMLNRFNDQAATILISANRNLSRYRRLGAPVIPDVTPGFQGPMAGLHALWHACNERYFLLVPVDALQLPTELADVMRRAARGAVTVARCLGDDHFPCALFDRKLIFQPPRRHGSLRRWYQDLGGWSSVTMPEGTVLSANTHSELRQLT